MKYSFIYNPVALIEYAEAVAYYTVNSDSAATEYYNAFNAKLADICNNPFAYKSIYKNFREALVDKFPYSIFITLMRNSV